MDFKNKDAILVTVIFGIILEIGRHFFSNIVDFLSNVGISFVDAMIDFFYRVVSTYSPLSTSYSFIQFLSVMMLSVSIGLTSAHSFTNRKNTMY